MVSTGQIDYNEGTMAIEIKRPKEDRGQRWVWAQLVLFILYLALPPFYTPYWNSGILTFGVLLMGWGLMFTLGAFANLGRQNGWRNLTFFPKPLRGLSLITDGAYAYIRHPIYFGIILMAFGYAFYDQNVPKILAAIALGVFFDFKSKREEFFLKAAFPEYIDYTGRVKRLIPGLY
jgi:protein-S-isoprenylcysteine O-methyltransferase Ste14